MARRVEIPVFDPDVDAYIIHVAAEGKDYTFVADIAAMQGLARLKSEFDVTDVEDVSADEANRQLDAGIEAMVLCGVKRHPDLTTDQIKNWFPSILSLQTVVLGFQDYLEEMQGGTPGEAAPVKRTRAKAKSNGRK